MKAPDFDVNILEALSTSSVILLMEVEAFIKTSRLLNSPL